MLPSGRSLSRPGQVADGSKSSSVLLLLYPEGDELFCCLLKRQPYLRYHGGQIGFPGGKTEKEDVSLLHTALRESEEEVGVRLSEENIIGSLSKLYVSVSGFLMYPFVAWVSPKPRFTIDFREVDKLLSFPFLSFLHNRKVKTVEVETQTGRMEVPAYLHEGEIIWGATAMILAEFFEILEQQLAERG